jgi:hypothetical protein
MLASATPTAPPAGPAGGPPTQRDHLAALHARLDVTDAAVRALVAGLSPAQRLWRPTPDAWGIADCFEHLLTTAGLYHPRVAAALAAAPPAPADAAWRPTWFGRRFIAAAGPGGRPIRAFRVFVPPPAAPDAPERFLARQAELRGFVVAAAGRDLRAPKVPSPLSRFLTLRLGEALHMLVVHQHRHLLQAERVRAHPAFPAA